MSMMKTPLIVNGLELKNRLVLPPMATEKSDSGAVTDALCAYYDEKTRDGLLGLVVTEHCFVNPRGKASPGQMSIARDEDIPGLRRLTDTIHKNGSPVFAQISHAGGAARAAVIGMPAQAPSAVAYTFRKKVPEGEQILPEEMTAEDIRTVTADFAAAALRAKEAGFDGVVIHSAHGYLLNQFYSPLANHRQDAYGGSLENRVRIHLEVIAAVRQAVGADYPVTLRLGAQDYLEGGSTAEDAVAAARLFEQAGIDLLKISGGFCGWYHPVEGELGFFTADSRRIRQAVSIPVEVTGGIDSGKTAEAILQAGDADLIGVARPILNDSDWAKKNLADL